MPAARVKVAHSSIRLAAAAAAADDDDDDDDGNERYNAAVDMDGTGLGSHRSVA